MGRECICKTQKIINIKNTVIGYGRSLNVYIDFNKKSIVVNYDYAVDSGTSDKFSIKNCPFCGNKL